MAKIEQLKQSISDVDDSLIKLRDEGHGYSSNLEAYKKERSNLKDKMVRKWNEISRKYSSWPCYSKKFNTTQLDTKMNWPS
jgi:chromosome segregation ATPase